MKKDFFNAGIFLAMTLVVVALSGYGLVKVGPDAYDALKPLMAVAFPGEFGTPATPEPVSQNPAYAHYDVQVHNRDRFAQWDATMAAQHGSSCEGPPATHAVLSLSDAVFICNDHVMTSGNAGGYGEIMITPSQIVNCSTGCTVQWDQSTQRMSLRDWPDVWLTPWNDNLALPFDAGDVDLQGVPRQGIHVNAPFSQNSWAVATIANYQETYLPFDQYTGMGSGIDAGVNQAAVRQTFRLTITPGHVKMERLPSATAPIGITWVDADCACLLAPDYVVQFGHHIYNPEKDGAGIPATWHWSNFVLGNSAPFTLIHTTPALATANNTLVTFAAPAPANAFLRFSGVCRVLIDGNMAPRQTFVGHPEHASSYFIPLAQGKQSVSVSFAPDDWYGGPCGAQDFHVWAKTGTIPPSPTVVAPTPTAVPVVTPTPINTVTPIAPTSTPPPTATATPVPPTPTRTPTPSAQRQSCTLRWGNGTLENYGQLTQAECAARGN